MAQGTVNTPGVTGPELEEVRRLAENAMNTADSALKKIGEYTNIIQSIPLQSNILIFSGEVQEPAWYGYDPEIMTISGYDAKINAGDYRVTFTPVEGYRWWDGSEEGKEAVWTIGRQPVSTPSQRGSLTYDGTEQAPVWDNLDGEKLTIGGVLTGTNAGEYDAEFTPAPNYCFSDGQSDTKIIKWSIGRSAGSLELSKSAVTISGGATTAAVTAFVLGDGVITAKSDNEKAVTVTVGEDNSTVTITALKSGSAYITVHAAAGTNYDPPADKTVYVSADVPSTDLAGNTPEMIQAVARSGQAPNWWKVGDRVPITLKGTVGILALNDTYYAMIIGFDHNASIEGSNSIHFQFGQNASGTNIAFCDSRYSGTGTDAAFRMNLSNVNTGGWNGSYMKTTICPALLAAMPKAWQDVIADCPKYSDNTGGGKDTASYVTKTSSKIWLLSEFEVQGARASANSAEKGYQEQYEYYQNGNNKIRYRHSATGSACHWWLRSVHATDTTAFCHVGTSGAASASYGATWSCGVAPGFKVA